MEFPIELGLILLFSILGGVLAVRFRQPSVLGLILVGAIVGPNALGIINDTELTSASLEIGAVLLLFTLGIEFNLQKLFDYGLRAIIIGIFKIGVVFTLSYYASIILGLDSLTGIFIGVILSITSTVIVIKILEQKGFAKAKELPLLVTILIIEDIFAIFALTFFSGLNAKSDLEPYNIIADLVLSLALMIVVYFLIQKFLKKAVNYLSKYSAEETITFLSLGICALMSYIALEFGLSPSVGAFLAGNVVSSLPNSKAFEKAIHPFLLAFTSLFFFSIGTSVNFSAISSSIVIVIALFLVNTIAKFLTIGFGTYMMTNYSGKQAVFSAIAMVSVGEFSLLIAKESQYLGVSLDLVSITAAIIFLSAISMNIFITHNDSIYKFTFKLIPKRARADMFLFSKYVDGISFSAIKDKFSYGKISSGWKIIVRNLVSLFFGFVLIFFFWKDAIFYLSRMFTNTIALNILIFIFAVAFFFPAFRIFSTARKIFKSSIVLATKVFPKEVEEDRRMMGHFALIMGLFVLVMMMPLLSVFFRIGYLRHIVVGLLITAMVFYMARSFKMLERLSKSKDSKLESFEKQYIKNKKKIEEEREESKEEP